MSKRLITIIVALVAVVGLAVGLVVVLGMPEDTTGNTDSSGETNDTPTATISIHKNKGKVASVVLKLQDGEYTLERDKDGVLGVKGLTDLPVFGDAVTALTDTLAEINANRQLTDALEPEKYGFGKPQALVTVTYEDGKSYAFELGMDSPVSDEVYFREKGSDDIYMVDAAFAATVVQPATAYVGVNLITAPEVKSDDANGQPVLRDITLSGKVHGDRTLKIRRTNSEDSDTMLLYPFWIEAPYQRGANDEIAQEIFGTAYTMTADTALYAHPTEDEKKQCGFDNPLVKAELNVATLTAEESTEEDDIEQEVQKTIYYNVSSHTVTIGDKNGDGQYYVMVDDLDAIYLVSESEILWAEKTYDDIASKILFLQDITTIQSIELMADGKVSKFMLTHDAEADNADDMLTVTLNGAQKDTAQFRRLYQVMMGVERIAGADKAPTGTPDVAIRLLPVDSRDAIIAVNLYKTSGSRYTCVMTDGDVYAASAGSVETLVKQLNNYLNGKDVLVY